MNNLVKWALIVVVVLFVLIAIPSCSYNRLVRLSQGVDQQWAQVQNVYQRRADLIPNLVQTVQGAANFEKSTTTSARSAGPSQRPWTATLPTVMLRTFCS